MTDSEFPRPINYSEIRKGDTITRALNDQGVLAGRTGVAFKETAYGSWYTAEGGFIASIHDDADSLVTLTLMDRPAPPPLPTEEGATILAVLMGRKDEVVLWRNPEFHFYGWSGPQGYTDSDRILSWRPAVTVPEPDLSEHGIAALSNRGEVICNCQVRFETSNDYLQHVAEKWGVLKGKTE